jgi:radical SAM superfamily enzyme YgiQ (UPF0313 family)
MKITIVGPSVRHSSAANGRGRADIPPAVFSHLIALTPQRHRLRLIDERIEPVDFLAPTDLVAITCITATAIRTYELGDIYRGLGVPVVIGGPHTAALPEEALEHADAIAIGDAERTWPRILEDAASHSLQPVYDGRDPSPPPQIVPRHNLPHRSCYTFPVAIQTGRGDAVGYDLNGLPCWNSYEERRRSVEEVAAAGRRKIIFTDDDMLWPDDRAEQLLEAIEPMRLSWIGRTSVDTVLSGDLSTKARRSGCKAMVVAFGPMSRTADVDYRTQAKEAVQALHAARIGVIGEMTFGYDTDGQETFRDTVDAVLDMRIDLARFAILTPYPGSRLYRQLDTGNRIMDRNWENYTGRCTVFRPKLLTRDELDVGREWAERAFYSLPVIAARLLRFDPYVGRLLMVNREHREACERQKAA